MLGGEFGDRAHAQQVHRAGHSLGQDLQGSAHSRLPAGHQSVEVGPPDHHGICTLSHRRHDVGAVPDTAVDQHEGLGVNGSEDLGQDR